MLTWEPIFNKITDPTTKTVFLAIGCSMKYYEFLNESNNQQYPRFLDVLPDNKVIILIDPELEDRLKIQDYFDTVGRPLVVVPTVELDNSIIPKLRILQNENTTVFAINDKLGFEVTPYMTHDEHVKTDCDVSLILNLISMCLGKVEKTKLIIQNYTGYDATKFYMDLLNSFDKKDIFDNILIDVTQRDGSCIVDNTTINIRLSHDGSIIQEKYLPLVEIVDTCHYDTFLRSRINDVIYPMAFCYVGLFNSSDFEIFGQDRIKLLSIIYKYDYDPTNTDVDYILATIKELIRIVLLDIIMSRECDRSLVDHLMEIITDRLRFINTVSILKFE